jgi:hypothetical protein
VLSRRFLGWQTRGDRRYRSDGKGTHVADIEIAPLDVEGLRLQLAAFERQYETASSRLAEAFREDGELVETSDFLQWSFLYSVARRRGLAT